MKIFIGKNMSCAFNYEYRFLISYILKYNIGEIVSDPKEADVLIFTSTCCGAKNQILYTLDYLTSIIEQKKEGAITFVSGCITRTFFDDEFNKQITEFLNKNFDYIIPEHREDMLINILTNKQLLTQNNGVCLTNNNVADLFISSGCNNRCSFCKTTYQDLTLNSINFERIEASIKNLPQHVDTVRLLGTNICQYGIDLYNTPRLMDIISLLETIDSVKKIRLLGFAYKDAIQNDFSYIMSQSKKIHSIIGSLESGSDRLLELMNKGFNVSEFLNFIREIQKNYKRNFVLDIIAGFPTENMEDIKATLSVLKEVQPYKVPIHKYCDSNLVYSHKYDQLTKEDINEHYKIYKKVLDREGLFNKKRY